MQNDTSVPEHTTSAVAESMLAICYWYERYALTGPKGWTSAEQRMLMRPPNQRTRMRANSPATNTTAYPSAPQ